MQVIIATLLISQKNRLTAETTHKTLAVSATVFVNLTDWLWSKQHLSTVTNILKREYYRVFIEIVW